MAIQIELNTIIKSLQEKGVINLNGQIMTKMKGTTDGLVYVFSGNNTPQSVLKIDNPQEIALIEQYLTTYENIELLPKILSIDPEKNFIVYTFIEGTTHYNRGSKLNWLTHLVKEFFNHYKKCNQTEQWGRLKLPRESWMEFNKHSVESAYSNLGKILPIEDYHKVNSIVKRIGEREMLQEKYLLHGDTGVHNFVFNNASLTGIIDPSPMIGPVFYDFTYAFCSSPDDLDLETLRSTFSLLTNVRIEETKLIEEMVVQLYTRIGICAKVHPHDLKAYLKAWDYWKVLI